MLKTILAAWLLLALAACSPKTPQPAGGYLGNHHVVFPADRYMFLTASKTEKDRTVITDNLWGYRYPSMAPLMHGQRGEFMRAYAGTDWVKVAVMVHVPVTPADPARTCMNHGIRSAQTPVISFLEGQDVYLRDPKRYFGGLHRLHVPERAPYDRFETFTGVLQIFWDDSSGAACTMIQCSAIPRSGTAQYCKHAYVDTARNLQFSMNYDAAMLPHWRDIQRQTVTIFNSFK